MFQVVSRAVRSARWAAARRGIADAIAEGMPTSPFERGRPTRGGYRDVGPAEALAARGAVRLVDVREPHEYTGDGHIAGAELVPLATLSGAMRAWPRERDVIVICRSGGRSARAAEAMVAAGFARVMNLAGGMLAYQAAGLPVER